MFPRATVSLTLMVLVLFVVYQGILAEYPEEKRPEKYNGRG